MPERKSWYASEAYPAGMSTIARQYSDGLTRFAAATKNFGTKDAPEDLADTQQMRW
jgi:hypothetical protein